MNEWGLVCFCLVCSNILCIAALCMFTLNVTDHALGKNKAEVYDIDDVDRRIIFRDKKVQIVLTPKEVWMSLMLVREKDFGNYTDKQEREFGTRTDEPASE